MLWVRRRVRVVLYKGEGGGRRQVVRWWLGLGYSLLAALGLPSSPLRRPSRLPWPAGGSLLPSARSPLPFLPACPLAFPAPAGRRSPSPGCMTARGLRRGGFFFSGPPHRLGIPSSLLGLWWLSRLPPLSRVRHPVLDGVGSSPAPRPPVDSLHPSRAGVSRPSTEKEPQSSPGKRRSVKGCYRSTQLAPWRDVE